MVQDFNPTGGQVSRLHGELKTRSCREEVSRWVVYMPRHCVFPGFCTSRDPAGDGVCRHYRPDTTATGRNIQKKPAEAGFFATERSCQATLTISSAAMRLPSSAAFWNDSIWSKFM